MFLEGGDGPEAAEYPRLKAELDALESVSIQKNCTPIYEATFLGFSYGFRPGRNPHQALDAVAVGIPRKRVNWVLDADIKAFFDTVDQAWMMRFLEHRIGDRRVLRLIHKWLTAGVVEDGSAISTTTPSRATWTA